MSVDGFLARPDDALDFLHTGEQEPHGFKEFLASVDVVVIGRRTFDVVLKLGHLTLYGKKPVVVLSSRPLDFSSGKGGVVEQMSGEPTEIVKQLKSRGFKHAYIDGGITIQRFLAAGCIDRLVITRVPVLIGAGIPEHRARVYETGLQTGGILVGVEARADDDVEKLEKLFEDLGAEHVRAE